MTNLTINCCTAICCRHHAPRSQPVGASHSTGFPLRCIPLLLEFVRREKAAGISEANIKSDVDDVLQLFLAQGEYAAEAILADATRMLREQNLKPSVQL
jgi:hypothetical protein